LTCRRIQPDVVVPTAATQMATTIVQQCMLRKERLNASILLCRAYDVSTTDCVTFCLELLDKEPAQGIKFMDALHLSDEIPSRFVLQCLLTKNQVLLADKYVAHNAPLHRLYIQMLLDNKECDKVIKKRMQKYKIDPNDFPEFTLRLVVNTVDILTVLFIS